MSQIFATLCSCLPSSARRGTQHRTYGVTFLGYSPKLVVTNAVYQLTGFSGSTFVLKIAVTLGIVWYLADAKAEMDRTWWWLMTFIIGAIGLPMGVRGSLRMMLGV